MLFLFVIVFYEVGEYYYEWEWRRVIEGYVVFIGRLI